MYTKVVFDLDVYALVDRGSNRFESAIKESHFTEFKRIIYYLFGTIDLVLRYPHSFYFEILL